MKRTRFKIAIWTLAFLAAVIIYCIYQATFETVATTAVAGILTITTMYIGGDSFRPSKTEA